MLSKMLPAPPTPTSASSTSATRRDNAPKVEVAEAPKPTPATRKEPEPAPAPVEPPKKEWPFVLCDSYSDHGGRDTLDIYAIKPGETLDKNDLVEWCRQLRAKSLSPGFYAVALFDAPENARRSVAPIMGQYGMIDEDKFAQQHIRMTYYFNRINGYSTLSYYAINCGESRGEEMKVPK